MDPKKIVADFASDISLHAQTGAGKEEATPASEPAAPAAEPGLFDEVPALPEIAPPTPVPGPAAGPVDEFEHHLAEYGRLRPLLDLLTRGSYAHAVDPAWEHYQATKDPGKFVLVVKRFLAFEKIVRRANRMLPTLRMAKHPMASTVADGLRPGALADREARKKWEDIADQCWREFLLTAGPFAAEIEKEMA